jgi:hypothetical protein
VERGWLLQRLDGFFISFIVEIHNRLKTVTKQPMTTPDVTVIDVISSIIIIIIYSTSMLIVTIAVVINQIVILHDFVIKSEQ